MRLSPRLKYISELVSDGKKIADIGTDHGYIPISLLLDKKISFAILSDINRGPLNNAKKEVTKNNVQNYVDLRLGSGMETLRDGEVDQVIIAGMGGILISEIIEKRIELSKKLDKLILQPMQAAEDLRKYLFNRGFVIVDEHFVREEHRIYEILEVRYDNSNISYFNRNNTDNIENKYNSNINNIESMYNSNIYEENVKNTNSINKDIDNLMLEYKINIFTLYEKYKYKSELSIINNIHNNSLHSNLADNLLFDKVINNIFFEVPKIMLQKNSTLLTPFLDKKIKECETIVSKLYAADFKKNEDDILSLNLENKNIKNRIDEVNIKKEILKLLKFDMEELL